jgi:hypothetical protein
MDCVKTPQDARIERCGVIEQFVVELNKVQATEESSGAYHGGGPVPPHRSEYFNLG